MPTVTFLRQGREVQTIDAACMSERKAKRLARRNGMTGAVIVGRSAGGKVEARSLRGDGTLATIRAVPDVVPHRRRRGANKSGRVTVLKVDDRPIAD